MQNECNSRADPEKWDTSDTNDPGHKWFPFPAADTSVISPKQISYQKLHSQVQLIYCWIYETSSQRRSCEAELYFSMKQQRMRLTEGLHRKTESDKLQPCCSAFTMFYLCQAPHVQTSFSSKKKKEREEKEINLLRPEGCAHQLLELMKNTLELWVRKSWLLISEG